MPVDLSLASEGSAYRLQPCSAVGMVWLQTHFDDSCWLQLAAGQVVVGRSSIDLLCQDATAAGLRIGRTPALPLPLSQPS